MSPILLYVLLRTVHSHLDPRPHVRRPRMHLNRHRVVGDKGLGLVPERSRLGLELDRRRKTLFHHITIIGLKHVGRTSVELLRLADKSLLRGRLGLSFLNHHSRVLVWVRGDHYPRASVGIRNFLFFFIPAEVETLFEACLNFIDIDGVDGGRHVVILVLVQFLRDVFLCLMGVSDYLSSYPVETLQEVLGIQVLSCCEESIDVPRNHVQESFHPVLVVQSQLLLICFHLSENIPLFGIKKSVHEIEGLVSGLDDHFLKQFFLVVDGFEERVLGRGRGTMRLF